MDQIPLDIVKHILSYDIRFVIRDGKIIQINKISENDERYEMLYRIPMKEYDQDNDDQNNNRPDSWVYLSINDDKDYFLSYTNYEIQLQTFDYSSGNCVRFIEGHKHFII